MSMNSRTLLENLYLKTGKLIKIGTYTLAAMIVLGSLFCCMAIVSFHVSHQPEKLFHIQAFMFNYSDFSHVEKDTTLSAAQPHNAINLHQPQDPNWDGVLAGAGLGFTLGQNIPFIGCIAGPVIGAMLGYEMDSRI